MLNDLQLVISQPAANGSGGIDRVTIDQKVIALKAKISDSNNAIVESSELLKQKAGSVGESYHWLVFVLIFACSYALSSE